MCFQKSHLNHSRSDDSDLEFGHIASKTSARNPYSLNGRGGEKGAMPPHHPSSGMLPTSPARARVTCSIYKT